MNITTSKDLQDRESPVNRVDKHEGRSVFNTDTKATLTAVGSKPTDEWGAYRHGCMFTPAGFIIHHTPC